MHAKRVLEQNCAWTIRKRKLRSHFRGNRRREVASHASTSHLHAEHDGYIAIEHC
jgi:hypothetical protein